MDSSSQEGKGKKKITEVKTFPVPFALEEKKEHITITTNTPSKQSKEQIINQAFKFHSQGNILEAAKLYQHLINEGCNDYRIFSHYGVILKNLGKLQEAEASLRKAIELNPNSAKAHTNLGSILRNLGKLNEAEISLHKAIEINPDFANAHYNLGNVLKDLGKLNEAELSLRQAIRIKSDFAEAHSNLGNVLRDLGKLQDAELSTRKAIEINPDYAISHSNLGSILIDLGKLQDAELSIRKAIELMPDHAMSHCNLGSIFIKLGKFKEAELSIRKAIELNPNIAKGYYHLSLLKYSEDNQIWQDQLFSKSILNSRLQDDQIYIYFARSNILHKERNYRESAKYLQLANKLKLILKPSKLDDQFNNSKILLIESNKKEINKIEYTNFPESIFIVGMPRSGSTLLESILSMNSSVDDLGEIKILEEAFLETKRVNHALTLAEEYWRKIKDLKKKCNITTNKNLFNYQYAGIIAKKIPNAKIIHCFRNPLDNILSIYRAHFAHGNEYSSSLVDCARVYLDQEDLMTEYKKRFRSTIYDLNYDSLVSNPKTEIKSLISWLGWEWDNEYLSPHLNPRSVSTASSVQVRSPINSKSISGWKNYQNMLQPAIQILTQNHRYRELIS